MTKICFTILVSFMIPFNSYALTCAKPVTYLQESQPAPCTGYLFTPEQEQEVRQLIMHGEFLQKFNDKLEKLSETQDRLINTANARIANLEVQNQALADKNAQLDSWWMKLVYSVAGGLVVGLIIKVYER